MFGKIRAATNGLMRKKTNCRIAQGPFNYGALFYMLKNGIIDSMEYKYTAIVLNKRDVGETDRIYTVYTLEGGKMHSVAKGIRKPEAKLASALETLDMIDLTIVKNRGNGKISGSITEKTFPALKNDWDALREVFRGVAFFDKVVEVESVDQKLFFLLLEYIATADAFAHRGLPADKQSLLRMGFSVKLMEFLGYKIEVRACIANGCAFSGTQFYFSCHMGGFVCRKCAEKVPGMIPASVNSIKMMRIFFQNNLQSFEKISIEKKDLQVLSRLVQSFIAWSV